MGSFADRLREWWSGLDKSQRPMYMLGGGLLVMMLIAVMFFSSRPQHALLFSGLTPADQGMVVEELNKLGITAEYDANGNVKVVSSKVNEARAKLAVARKLPQTGNMGYGGFDSITMTTSPAVEREKIKAAIEGELANSIQKIAGVASARVHLTMPEESPFLRETKPSSASVMLTEQPGAQIMPEQAQAIARLVQYAVSGLKPENISLVNEKGMTLFDGSNLVASNGTATSKLAAEISESQRRQRELQKQLDVAFGPGNTVVSIPQLSLNYDKVHESTVEKGPSKKPISKEEVTESMGEGATEGVGTGSASNLEAPTSVPTSGGKNYTSSHTNEVYEINESRKEIEHSSGDLEGMTVNVLVNSAVIKDIAPVETYVKGYLGPLATNTEAFLTTVTPVEFDSSGKKASEAASAAAAGAARNNQIMALLPIIALVIVGFLVVKALGKAIPERKMEAINLEVALPGGGSMTLPASAVEDLPPSAIGKNEKGEQVIEIAGNELASALHALASSHVPVQIDDIPDKVNVPLEQIKKMAVSKPEQVAKLIKTWILEDRK